MKTKMITAALFLGIAFTSCGGGEEAKTDEKKTDSVPAKVEETVVPEDSVATSDTTHAHEEHEGEHDND